MSACTTIIVNDERVLSRVAVKTFRKLKPILKNKNQLHATDDSDRTKLSILKYLKDIDYRIVYISVSKKDNKDKYLENLYLLFIKLKESNIEKIFVANRESRKRVREEIRVVGRKTCNAEIILTSTLDEKGLQIADFISWSIYQKYENMNDTYYKLLFGNPDKK